MPNYVATGQPIKLLKEEILNKLVHAISKGATIHLACKHAGIDYEIFRLLRNKVRRYIKNGVDENGKEVDETNVYLKIYRKIESALGDRALMWLEKVESASEIHWQAAAWKLERCHPESYARQDKRIERKLDKNNEGIAEVKELLEKCKQPSALK